MSSPDTPAREPRFGMLRSIALYKLIKVALLLAAAYGEVKLHDAALVTRLANWAQARPAGLEQDVVTWVLEWFSGLSEARVHVLRLVTYTYAVVLTIEGVGLWLRRRWAEWLTVVVTASLIPLELWEFFRKPHVGKMAVVVANAAIVAYLVWHVRGRGSSRTVNGRRRIVPGIFVK